MKLQQFTEDNFLFEANVFNIKEPFKGTSIAKFVAFYADQLGTTVAKKVYSKKLSKLLMNDGRFHHALREVPDGAPEWAVEASQKGELVYFVPDEDLKQAIEHLAHYVNALERDIKQTDDEEKHLIAQRELDAFTKAQDLSVLNKSAETYFKRGSKKAKGDLSGIEPRLKAGTFTWYELIEPEAYRREGKVLQNCIGSHYTASKCENQGMKIYVLKKQDGETVAATRVNKEEILEMKGKQNLPPVSKYMPPVQKFIEKSGLGLSQGMINDLQRAGYFYREGQMYTKEQAIEKFVHVKSEHGTTNSGKIVELEIDDKELFKAIYAQGDYQLKRKIDDYGSGSLKLFELRKNNKPVISAMATPRGEVINIQNHEAALAESFLFEANASLGKSSIDFFQTLLDKGLINTFSPEITKHMFWSNNLKFDSKKKQIVSRDADTDDFKTDKTHHAWKVHTGAASADSLMRAIASDVSTYGDRSREVENLQKSIGKNTDIKATYITANATPTVIIFVNNKNEGHPFEVSVGDNNIKISDETVGHTNNDVGDINKKTVASLMALANDKGFSLPDNFKIRHGVQTDKDEKYSSHTIEPKVLSGDPPTYKYAFGELSPKNRLPAMVRVISDPEHGDSTNYNKKDKFNYHEKEPHMDGGSAPKHKFSKDEKQFADILKTHMRGAEDMYKLGVNFGGGKEHDILMLAKDKKIVFVDNVSDKHQWQHWDDNENVIQQLNDFADKYNMTFAKDALKGQGEMRTNKEGKLHTAEHEAHQKFERQRARGQYAKEGTDHIEFEDGSKFERMTPEENARMSRMMPKTARGEVWKFIDDHGENTANILVSRDKVVATYKPAWGDMNQWAKNRMKDNPQDIEAAKANSKKKPAPELYKHIKKAAKEFGWTVKLKDAEVGEESPMYKFLDQLHAASPQRRGTVYRSSQLRASAPKWDRDEKIVIDKKLEKLGFLKVNKTGAQHSWLLSITDKGKDFVKTIKNGGNLMDAVDEIGTHKDWSKPEKGSAKKKDSKPAKKTSSTSATTRGGTKASQALDKFTKMTDDNDGTIPTRKEFIEILTADPFNMSKSGAQTYYYTTKAKYNKAQGITESFGSFSLLESLRY